MLNYLLKEYSPFKISYDTHKENCSINELLAMCVQEEEMLKHEKLDVKPTNANPITYGKENKKN